ncbi:ATP-binding protein, partial [Nocardioides sp.]|uniref:ATP-binding protein n=1 Tax=Nocardioides sp. TaxID=35761 RepID=UPI0027358350
ATDEHAEALRENLDDWLTELGAGLMDHVGVVHAFTEIVENVVRHAYDYEAARPPPEMTVEARLHETGVLRIEVRDRGRWREHEQNGHGRGLMMAGGLVDRVQVRRGPTGTTVTIEERLGHPVQMLTAFGDLPATGSQLADQARIRVTRGGVAAEGVLDSHNADELRAAVLEASHAGARDAKVNLNKVTHLGSAAVHILFEMCRRSRDNESDLVLIASDGTPAHQILDVVSLAHTG